MKAKSLWWIIPLSLILGIIIGGLIGFNFCAKTIEYSENLIDESCNFFMDSINYVMENDEKCKLLIMGYAQENKDNFTNNVISGGS